MRRYPAYPRSPFSRFARWTARATGHPLAFLLAVLVIVVWLATGPIFGFSDTWQLIINTGTTIMTFLMVFLIQNTQNHDGAAVQLKLDELIRAERSAHNALLDLEALTDAELDRLRAHYADLARLAHEELRRGRKDTGTPDTPFDWSSTAGGTRDRARLDPLPRIKQSASVDAGGGRAPYLRAARRAPR